MNSWPARCAGVIRRYAARTGAGTGDVDGAGSVPGVDPVVEDGEAADLGGGAVRDGTADAEVVGDVRFAVVELRADGLLAEGVPEVGPAPEEVDGAAAADAGGVLPPCPVEDVEQPAGVMASRPVRAPRSRAERRMSEPERLGAV